MKHRAKQLLHVQTSQTIDKTMWHLHPLSFWWAVKDIGFTCTRANAILFPFPYTSPKKNRAWENKQPKFLYRRKTSLPYFLSGFYCIWSDTSLCEPEMKSSTTLTVGCQRYQQYWKPLFHFFQNIYCLLGIHVVSGKRKTSPGEISPLTNNLALSTA